MRNLIVCCDGTWNTPDQRDQGVPVPTNVVRLYNAIADSHGTTPQSKYYHPGVGTDPGRLKRAVAGATGDGLDKNIMSAYHWLCRQYQPDDRIFLFGFSRGAYTVRSLGGMIAACGLLDLSGENPKTAWARIEHVFQHGYRLREQPSGDWKTWPVHSNAGAPVKIWFIGVWDTVGALGIPDDLGVLNLFDADKDHQFHDTDLSPQVEHARHAVAMDEIRASFQPTLWTGTHQDLKQLWFPGVHGDVGGGYRETGLSDGALLWMIEEAEALGLGFDAKMRSQIEPSAQDVLHDSCIDVFRLLPNQPRSVPCLTPPRGHRTELHPSVAARRASPPISDAPYRPTATSLRKGQSHAFDVFAMQPWNGTGLYVKAGEVYRFTAEGEWVDGSVACGPEGTSDGEFQAGELAQMLGSALGELEGVFKRLTGNDRADFKFTKRHDRLDGERVPWFCLIGAVANGGQVNARGRPTEHETFVIGAGRDHTIGASGYLYFYANDAWNFYTNNRGSVRVEVRRV